MSAVVGMLTLHLYLPDNQSLKEKRMVLNALKDGLRRHFNISVGELDGTDSWQRTVLGIVGIGADRRYVNGQLSQVMEWTQRQRAVELTDYELTWW